ncbi:MAG: MarR family transcriptional regulator [Gammaproteobacteria bacterium]|nr:MAG: MarR family transcriptional regulator [Gammaproteobacteria bacterium]
MLEQNNAIKALKLKEFLPYRLSVLSNRISRSITERYEDKFKLSTAEWRTVAILGEESDLSAAEVADRAAMDKVAISRAVNNLILHGRLIRDFSEDDRRRSVLALSDKGRDIYQQIVPLALSYEALLLDELSREENQFLDSILEKLYQIQLNA